MAATVSASSVIDVSAIVTGLMTVEKQPLYKMQSAQVKDKAKLSAYGTVYSDVDALNTALKNLKEVSAFEGKTASSSDSTVATASATAVATKGAFDFGVTTLAQSHKLRTATFADKTSDIGAGSLTISNAGSSFVVTLPADASNLEEVQNAINSASDNIGVTASIIYDGSAYRLSLSASDTGVSKALTVVAKDGSGNVLSDPAGLGKFAQANLTVTQAAQDFSGTVDGVAVTNASNTLTTAISGVTLTAKQAGTTVVTVASDTLSIQSKVMAFVGAYNKINSDFKSLHAKGATLAGDTTLVSMQTQLRDVLNTPAAITGVSYKYLAEIGITLDKDGQMSLKEADFQAALTSKPADVKSLFTDTTHGFAVRFQSLTNGFVSVSGGIKSRQNGFTKSIDDFDIRIARMNDKLDAMEKQFRTQYANLNTLLGKMNNSGNQLLGALEKLS